MNQDQIIKLASQRGWKLRNNPDPYVLIFDQGGGQINVWFTKMTVGIFLRIKNWTDYKRGVYHRKVIEKELKNIFKKTSKVGQRETTYKTTNTKFNLPPIIISGPN